MPGKAIATEAQQSRSLRKPNGHQSDRFAFIWISWRSFAVRQYGENREARSTTSGCVVSSTFADSPTRLSGVE